MMGIAKWNVLTVDCVLFRKTKVQDVNLMLALVVVLRAQKKVLRFYVLVKVVFRMHELNQGEHLQANLNCSV